MNSISKLEREADRRWSDLQATLADAKQGLSPASLIDKMLGSYDPELSSLDRWQKRASENPFALLAAFTGLGLLLQQLSAQPISTQTQKPTQRHGRVGVTPKGEYHGQHIFNK